MGKPLTRMVATGFLNASSPRLFMMMDRREMLGDGSEVLWLIWQWDPPIVFLLKKNWQWDHDTQIRVITTLWSL
jgi:hypothetical protein